MSENIDSQKENFSTEISIAAGQFSKEREYWLNRFSGELLKSSFPYDHPRKSPKECKLETAVFQLAGRIFARLMHLSKGTDPLLHMILVAAVMVLLGKYTGDKDIIIATPIDRQAEGKKFVNTVLALRNRIDNHITFKELLLEVRDTINGAFENRNYPIQRLFNDLGLAFSHDDDFPLLDTAVLVENIQEKSYIHHVKPNMVFSFLRTGERIEGKVEYNALLYTKTKIEKIITHLVNLLDEAIFNLDLRLDHINILSDQERYQLLVDFNNTKTGYPENKTIYELFTEQVKKAPDDIAVVFNREQLTYRELNEQSNSLAGELRENGARPDKIIGLLVEVSIEALIGIMGILKSGAAYLPLSSDQPAVRIKYMLKDSNTDLVLTVSRSGEEIDFPGNIIDLRHRSLFTGNRSNLEKINRPGNTVYVIYTSGSTGNPKGVIIRHSNITNQIFGLKEMYLFDCSLNHILMAPFTFDPSIQQIFLPLITGGKLFLVSNSTKNDMVELSNFIISKRVNILNTVPSLMNHLLDHIPHHCDIRFEYIILAGEIFSKDIYMKLKEKVSVDKIINIYGPTEATINTTLYQCLPGEKQSAISIGKPLMNYKVWILDEGLNLLPAGVPGEICISGRGIARGYLNHPELTKERFVENKLDEGRLMYRTGDRGKWLPGGNIEFLDRMDSQLKIRGQRVEPAEIESQLLHYQGVKEAVVVPGGKENLGKYLVAYIVADKPILASDLKEYLRGKLTHYMIPAQFIRVERIPLTPNGKLDRKALPAFEIKKEDQHLPPGNNIERKLAKIWSDILQIDKDSLHIDSDFFELGGHSLTATVLLARIYKELNLELKYVDIFTYSKIRELGELIKVKEEEIFVSIEPAEKREYYALSSAQKRLYILQQMDLDSLAYNISGIVKLEGELEKEKLEKAFRKLIKRHESLRTTFEIVEEAPVQMIHENVGFEIEYYDMKEVEVKVKGEAQTTGARSGTYMSSVIRHPSSEFIRPFDLSHAPLMRLVLIRIEEDKHTLMVDMHHIVTDGTSMILFVEEFFALYAGKELPSLRLQYKDYARWHNSEVQKEAVKEQENYWLEQLADEIPVLDLPTDFTRPAVQSFAGSTMSFQLPTELSTALNGLALNTGTTLFMVVLAIYNIFLNKLSSQEDIIVGTVIAARRHVDMERMIGMFVNTLVMRNYPVVNQTFNDFLSKLKERTLEAFENQDYQFEDLVEKVVANRDTGRNPLFDVIFTLQNMEARTTVIPVMQIPGLKVIPYEIENRTAKFDLNLTCIEKGDHLRFTFEYCTKLFRKETIQRFIIYLKKIINTVIENPGTTISEIEIITEAEKRQVLYEFNDTSIAYPKEKTIHRLFAEQVERTPDNIALHGCMIAWMHGEDGSITYKELSEKSDQLAYVLKKNGVETDIIVGIMTPPSVEMITGTMGILKAGGAYLPIDPEYPRDRIQYMLTDSSARFLVTTTGLSEKLSIVNCQLLLVNEKSHDRRRLNIPPKEANNDLQLKGNNLAYIIYTSGSTGTPKGTPVRHRGLNNLCHWHNRCYAVTSGDRASKYAGFGFDASVWEIFPYLITGAAIYIVEEEIRADIYRLNRFFERYHITISFLPTQVCEQFTELQNNSLRILLTGGDRLRRCAKRDYQLVNNYGPTENTVVSTWFILDHSRDNIPIGKPIDNTKLYILNPNYGLQPVGVNGELYISGVGLAIGYLNHPQLTAEKFIENPYQSPKSNNRYPITNRLYRTGDIARWLPDGNLEFMGRSDQQVKVRGFRVELGEIENHLLNYPGVRKAVVLANMDDNRDKYLCAYIIAKRKAQGAGRGETSLTVDSAELRAFLSKSLPHYMIPAYFVLIDNIPLTPNGKVNRHALPAPGITAGQDFTAPGNEIEKKMVALWSEVLGIEKNQISMDANFFNLGGHSLKATVVISKLHKAFNAKIPLAELFKAPTIRELAEFVRGLSAFEDRFLSIQPVEIKEYYPLSSAQKRLYILQRMDLGGTSYNIPGFIVLEGVLDIEKLDATFKKLIKRHDSLRTYFEMVNEEPVQFIHDEVEFEIEYYDASQVKVEVEESEGTGGLAPLPIERATGNPQPAAALISSFIRPFDLSGVPLLRVGLIKEEEEKYLLMVDMHHIITDGTSMDLFLREFAAIYADRQLPSLKLQYKDYAYWQRSEKQREAIKRQEVYWLKRFEGEIPVLDLPIDYSRPAFQSFEGQTLTFEFSKKYTRGINDLTLHTGTTLYMVLLAIYNILLSKLSSQGDIVVGTPIAARRHVDMERIIGMFVNTLPMRNYPEGDRTFRDFLNELKTSTLEVFENQEYQFEDLVDKVLVNRDISRNPLFDVMLSLPNMEAQVEGISLVEIPGLKVSPYESENRTAKFDLNLTCVESKSEERLFFTYEYCTKLFRKETIEKFVVYLKEIVNTVIRNPSIKIGDIEIITAPGKKQVLYEFNDTSTVYPKAKTIHRLFEEQVEKTPDKIAVVFEEKELTYRVLDERAIQLASELRERGVKTDTIVGIMIERSVEMVLGLIAILKAGGGYLPIDTEYPEERKIYMLKDSQPVILLTKNKYNRQIESVLKVVDIESEGIYRGNRDNFDLEGINNPGHLAYVIYTSGSTGRPKGVMVIHRNVVRLVKNTNYVEFRENDRILQTGALEFDASTFEIWGSLLNGLTLHIVCKDKILNTEKLEQVILRYKISTMWMTAPLFNQVSRIRLKIFGSLRNILVGGDVVSPSHINPVRRKYTGLNIINGYGPTENTTFSTTFLIKREYEESIPIGKPISNSTAYILDRSNKLLPIGVVGELWSGGDGVARGYLNNSELTKKKFIESPFVTNEILYRTGDLGRWLPDGNIEYIGRIDRQVKIRGFRIEAGEIESQLLKKKEIKETVVLTKEDKKGDRYLCAYIVSEKEFKTVDLRKWLSNYLPDYMIPSYFVKLDRLPLTPNGKLDIKAFPEPQLKPGVVYAAPGDEIEQKLLDIWSEVLSRDLLDAAPGGQPLIGIDDNFFEMGGHSLKATTLVHKIYKELNVNVKIIDVFTNPTIRELAQTIKESNKIEYIEITQSEEKEYYDLSYAQRRLWILCQFEEDSTAYNIPSAILISGSFHVDAFIKTAQTLVDRHESLRTVFTTVNGEPKQKIIKDFKFDLEYVDFRSLEEVPKEERTRESFREFANRPLNLEHGPLIQFKTIRLEDEKHLFISNFHHIINDGWSSGVINNELMILYDSLLENGKNPLSPVKLQYKDYTRWHNQLIDAATLYKSRVYWLNKFNDKPNGIELPLDHPRKPKQTFNGGRVPFTLGEARSYQLRRLNWKEESTIFMGLLTLLSILLYKYSGQDDIIIGFPIAGRKQLELNNMIGFLVNTLVFRNKINPSESFKNLLGRLKQESLTCYEYQDYPFDLLVEELGLERDLSQSPLFNVMMAHNNTETQDVGLQLEGLTFSDYSHSDDYNMSKFDLVFFLTENRDEIEPLFEYNSDLFERRTIERMSQNFLTLMDQVIEDSDVPISSYNPISPMEYERVVNEFNNTGYDYPGLTLQELFENRVEKSGEKTAVVFKGERITYSELNERVNRFAHYLRNVYKVKPNNVIGISVDRSIDMIVTLLGIMKSGAGYLALDPTYPRERVLYVLADTQAALLIIDKMRPELLGGYNGDILDINEHRDKIALQPAENPGVMNQPSDVLYVNYTSGSTGTPNGAMLSHHILTNLIRWQNEKTAIDCSLRCFQFTSINFCVSFQEIMGTLTSGGELYLIGDIERQDIDYLMDFLSEHQIEVLFSPFSYLNFLFNESSRWNRSFNHRLKHIITAGEQLKITAGLKRFLDLNPGLKLHNHYGSTEMHVVTSYTLDAFSADQTPIPPAGRPIVNVRIFILDDYYNPVPIGVWGELFVKGISEVLGYINNSALTDEKLLRHPKLSGGNDRLFRTGDIGRWTEDGNIELRGRKDFQVKIRGLRVEPGEIESKILSIKNVKECVVVVKEEEQGNKGLFAYMVVDQLDAAKIKEIVRNNLPQYMIPKFIFLDKLPLMPNGKVDREQLPDPKALEDYLEPIKAETVSGLLREGKYIKGVLTGSNTLSDDTPVKELITYHAYLFQQVSSAESLNISEIDYHILTGGELISMMSGAAQLGEAMYKTISRLFEQQVEKTPDNIAVAAAGEGLKPGPHNPITYRELNEKSNRLAHLLRTKGVNRGSIVGIMDVPSPEMLLGILAILKAGGAYLPIPADIPQNQVVSRLNENHVSLLLGHTRAIKNYSYTALQGLASGRVKCQQTAPRPTIAALDSLPLPDRSMVDYERYSRYIGITMVKHCITLLTSRGCPYNCAYCHKIWPNKQVCRSAENIFSEVKLYYDMGVRRFAFIDDIFNLNTGNSTRFFQLVLENKLDVQFYFSGGLRGDILTRDFTDLMVKAGTVNISMALETASPRLQKLIGKNLNVEKLRDNIEYICTNYPQVILELHTMHGFPTETKEEAMQTLDFIKSLKWVDFPYIHMVRIYPNTEMERIALQEGVSREAIINSEDLAFHEWSETSPFEKAFTQNYQAQFLNEYFLSKERLLHVLPRQMRVLTETDMVQKYHSYLPMEIKKLDDLFQFVGIGKEELGVKECQEDDLVRVPELNRKIGQYFRTTQSHEHHQQALRILLLDLSQFFSVEGMLYDVVEVPLGLISLLTYLNRHLGKKINAKCAKARSDFDNYDQLKTMLQDFRPHIIGLRTLTFYKDFFHKTAALIRQWGFDVPIIAGGPYATSDFNTLLQDANVDLVVLGEGEVTFLELVKKILDNDGEIPNDNILKTIPGLVLVPQQERSAKKSTRELLMLDTLTEISGEESVGNLEPLNQASDPALILYAPPGEEDREKMKKVMVTHNDIHQLLSRINGSGTPAASFLFEALPQQVFGTLLRGGSIYILPPYNRVSHVQLLEFYNSTETDGSAVTLTRIRLLLKRQPKTPIMMGESDETPKDEIDIQLVEIWSEVLGIPGERIGINTNFFELGGHSLKATLVISKIHKRLNKKIPLAEMFQTPTIRELANYIRGMEELEYSPVKPAEKKESYVLSSAQKRLYILQVMQKDNLSYNMPLVVVLEGELDKDKLGETFQQLIDRHESLRTSFEMVNNEPVQIINDSVEFAVEQLTPTVNHHQSIQEGIIRDFIRPFDLSGAPLLRVGLVKEEKKKHLLIVDMHHIITDGTSLELLVKEFTALYAGHKLFSLRLQYKDYAQWQVSEAQKKALTQQEKYWLKQFEGEVLVLDLPTDYPRPAVQSFEGNTLNFELSLEHSQGLNDLALHTEATLYMVLLAIFNVFLSKISDQEDIVVGTPIAARRHVDLERIIGMFVNTLALRNYPNSNKTFRDFLIELKKRTLEAFENQEYQFEDLVEKVTVSRDVSRNPLFDTLFGLPNMEVQTGEMPDVQIPGLKVSPYESENRTAKFDLNVTCIERKKKLFFAFEYCTKLFKEETIKRFITYFKEILSSVIDNPDKKISGIEILSKEEKQQVLFDFNNTRTTYPNDKTIHQLFEEQVERTPDHIALVGQIPKGVAPPAHKKAQIPNKYLSYMELNQTSDQLAHLLIEKGIQPDTIAGIMVEPSIVMIVGILGILKAGGAYLPISPDFPGERSDFILADSGAKVLLTTRTSDKQGEKLRRWDGEVLYLPLPGARPAYRENPSAICNRPLQLAYVIYTSGSTGKPKGVMVEHLSAVNILLALQQEYPLEESDAYLLKTSFVFDVSVTELFGWFPGGGRLVILEKKGEKDPGKILDTIKIAAVTHINFVPSLFNVFVDQMNPHNIGKLSGLKYIFLAGEALSPELVSKSRDLETGIVLENIYGPTEGTVYSSNYSLSQWDGIGRIPIGKPMPNICLYIFSKDNHIQPIGIPGELCIAGTGVARGYLNRPELTAEKFDHDLWDYLDYQDKRKKVPGKIHMQSCNHASMPLPQSPIYLTGDLARWLPDGNIEFLGRSDHQVKVRGFRVEPEEIESYLLKYEKIKEAMVLAAEDERGDKRLCAYITSDSELEAAELRNLLSGHLPDYMIPSYFVQMEEMPLIPSGKVDTKALRESTGKMKTGVEYAPPGNELEKTIANAWEELLGRERVGRNDNFFELGGTSLDIIRLSSEFNKIFSKEIPVVVMFRYPTVRSLAKYLEHTQSQVYSVPHRDDVLDKGKVSKKQRLQRRKEIKNG